MEGSHLWAKPEMDGFINFRKEEEGRRQSEMTSKVFDEDQQRSEPHLDREQGMLARLNQ
jgi:hypothetical protein